jgi:hypothetical protein
VSKVLTKSTLNREFERVRDKRPIPRRILVVARGKSMEILQECVAARARYATSVSLRHMGLTRGEAVGLTKRLLELQGGLEDG